MKTKLWLAMTLFSVISIVVNAKPLHIAVASNFSKTMQLLIKEFEHSADFRVAMSVGSSGKFYAQIKQGAPYSIFFSADQIKPIQLQKDGLAVIDSRFTYATGQLALWSTRSESISQLQSKLKNQEFNTVAIANPKLAPYGGAAIEVLQKLNLTNKSNLKIVQGENVSQTYQFVSTGNADLGFVALSQLLTTEGRSNGTYWLLPTTMYQPIKQDAVLLTRASEDQRAQSFLTFMQSNKASAIIAKYGYLVDETPMSQSVL
mgnify:CR=1 FL=1